MKIMKIKLLMMKMVEFFNAKVAKITKARSLLVKHKIWALLESEIEGLIKKTL